MVCNKRTIEALIKAGAFDSLGHARRGLLMVYEPAVDAVVDTKRNEAIGQFDLFGFGDLDGRDAPGASMFDVHVGDEEWDKPVLLAFEREMLGLYVSDHPLLGRRAHPRRGGRHLDRHAAVRADRGRRHSDGRRHPVVGQPPGHQGRARRGPERRWRISKARSRCCSSRRPTRRSGCRSSRTRSWCSKGRPQARDDSVELIVSDLTLPDLTDRAQGPVVVNIAPTLCTPPMVERLREVLAAHPGTTEVHLQLVTGERRQPAAAGRRLSGRPVGGAQGRPEGAARLAGAQRLTLVDVWAALSRRAR